MKSAPIAFGGIAILSDMAEAAGIPAKPTGEQTFLLSETGCGRATGYAETNKIVTVGHKTHVAWLDSVKGGFRVRVRTLNRSTGVWSPTYTIGEAYDNHGGPALTVDSGGYLHIVYYPHHHPFRYRRSVHPNDASEWGDEVQFGERCTYPTLLCGADDTLYLTCRVSRSKAPWIANLYTKPANGDWGEPATILISDKTGYSHFQEALAWGPDNKTIHLTARFYSGNPGYGHTVGYLRSRDFGKTWERADGKPVALPATPKTVDIIASRPGTKPPGVRCGAVAVDGENKPLVLFSSLGQLPGQAWIARPKNPTGWDLQPLNPLIEKEWPGWGLTMPGGIIAGDGGKRIHVVLTLFKPDIHTDEGTWGHPSSEVIWLESNDGGNSFSPIVITEPDPETPNWLPNIERPTGHNKVAMPSLIYTSGSKGTNNRQVVANKVFWVDGVR